MPEARLARTRAAYRPKPFDWYDDATPGLAPVILLRDTYDTPLVLSAEPSGVPIVTGRGRYFPNEDQRQRAAIARTPVHRLSGLPNYGGWDWS